MVSRVSVHSEGFDNENRSILVTDYHTEYSLPEMKKVSIRQMWDGFDFCGKLEDIEDDLKDTPDNLCFKLFKKRFVDEQPESDYPEPVFENYSDDDILTEANGMTIWRLTFWTGRDHHDLVKEYLRELRHCVREAVETASGDDTYFDYMPGFVDMFRQICEAFKEYDLYNTFVEGIIKNDPDLELYCDKIGKKD